MPIFWTTGKKELRYSVCPSNNLPVFCQSKINDSAEASDFPTQMIEYSLNKASKRQNKPRFYAALFNF